MWQIIAWVALTVVSYLLRPKQQAASTPTPGEVTGPTVDASSNVPVLFGTRWMEQPNCAWYGDVGTSAVVKCNSGKK